MSDVFLFAIPAKSPPGEYIVDRPRDAEIGAPVADQDRRQSAVAVDRACDRALADTACHLAGGIRVRKTDLEPPRPKSEHVGVQGDRNVEMAQRVTNRVI